MRELVVRSVLHRNRATLMTLDPKTLSWGAWFNKAASEENDETRAAAAANSIGICLVQTDWPTSRDLALSDKKSTQEISALKTLAARLPGCVQPKARLTIAYGKLRALTEEAIYHAASGVLPEANHA